MTVYDDKKAWAKLKEAMKVGEDCDPADGDCEECPIGKPMELIAHDAGVKVVASVCSMISALKDVCFEPKEYKYKTD
ncbi:hypothetical protein LCGC14_1512130 [marine sediment metagenome]|uniref:Uncharacterized protein n=1 Tax=marine sediment metagenome TaxID=412755 RepID=A0A0F9LGM8_9ZZZZ